MAKIRSRITVATPLDFRDVESMLRVLPRSLGSDDHDNRVHHTTGLSKVAAAIITVGVILGICAVGFLLFGFRRWKRNRSPRYTLSGRDDNYHTEATTIEAATLTAPSATVNRSQNNAAAVDRHTSVRSVMTLPAYRPKASESEHVLGREGERDGIDVVVELPTSEADEALREDEMDALYQIRLARRRQIAEREERRQARRDARARNDHIALHNLRMEARNATTTYATEIEELRNEHERTKETRQRAVSSVSYADVGVARHDGTRIRANSTESERMGLLSDAASIAASGHSRSSLSHVFARPELHRRERSASSVLSIDTTHSDNLPHPPRSTRSRASSTGQHTRAGSSPELIDAADADLGDSAIPPQSPPSYDEVSLNEITPVHSRSASPYAEPPPDYTPGPTEERNRRLSANMADLAAEASVVDVSLPRPQSVAGSAAAAGSNSSSRRSSNEGTGKPASARSSMIPQLPSLRLAHLPQIVIEPSSAAPRDAQQVHEEQDRQLQQQQQQQQQRLP